MKKILLILTGIFSATVFAQEEKIQFEKKIIYENSQNFANNIGDMYVNMQNQFLLSSTYYNVLVDNFKTASVNFGFDNRLTLYFLDESHDFSWKFSFEKLDTFENVLEQNCRNYLIKAEIQNNSFYGVLSEGGGSISKKVCINENSRINNILPFIVASFQLPDSSGETNRKILQNLSELKGLVLKFGDEEDYEKSYVAAKSIEDTQNFVFIDWKKNLDEWEKMQKIAKKQMDSLSAVDYITPDTADVSEDEYYFQNYESSYKNRPKENSYAIDNISTKNLWNAVPKYCRKIDELLPDFENPELAEHLKNYAGQICDLYLSESSRNVDIKGTTDEIRREVLFLNEIQNKLKDKDRNNLNKFLNSLD